MNRGSMRIFISILPCALLMLMAAALPAIALDRQSDVLQTSRGPLRITPIYHGSVMLEFAGKVIHIDPWSQGDYTDIPQADLILITHTHADHWDRGLFDKLKKPSTLIVGSPAVIDTINCSCPEAETISNGEKKTVMGIEIEGVPMYNIVYGAGPGKPFHHKGIGGGFILNFGDTRVYLSGDTECTPEMKSLKNINVAFLAMNAPRTMTPKEAALCVEAFRPKIVYPYHYRGQNVQEFADAVKGIPGVEVRLRKLEGEP